MNYRLFQSFTSPWIGTIILTLLGAALNYWVLDLSFVLQFMFGSVALLVVLRLYGLSFAVPALILIHLPMLWTGSFVTMTVLHGMEILFLALGFRWLPRASLLKLDLLFWVTIALPIIYGMHALRWNDEIDMRLVWLLLINRLLNGICNALLASATVVFLLNRVRVGKRPYYYMTIRCVIFKYLLMVVMTSSILILFVNGSQQFQDILHWGSNYVERSSRLYISRLEQLEGTEQQRLMQTYKQDFSIDSIIVDAENTVLATTIQQSEIGQFTESTGYRQSLLQQHNQVSVYAQYPIDAVYPPDRWQRSYFVLNTVLDDNQRLILVLPFSYHLYPVYGFYLKMMLRMLGIILLAAILAQLIGRRVAIPLQQLVDATSHIPQKLRENHTLEWPKSSIVEMRKLIHNFQQMVSTLEYQFLQIKKDKELLEIRVVERTFDLAESEAQKSAILKMAVDGIISTDSRLRITEMNPAAEQMFRCDLTEVSGLPLSDLIRIHGRTNPDRESSTVLAFRLDGSTFTAELTRSEILNDGAAVHTFFLHDLTEQEQALARNSEHERQLQQLTERLLEEQGAARMQKSITGNLLQTVQDGIMMCDEARIVSLINPTLQMLFGLDDYNGKPVSEVLERIQSQLMAGTFIVGERLNQHLDQHEEWEQGCLIQMQDERLLSLHLTPITDAASGVDQGFLLIFRDCTEEKRAKQLQNELIAVVSHELRTPLSAIMGYIEMLSMYEDIPAERRREFMNTIQFEGGRLSRLLDDFLDSQRIEAGHAEYLMSCIQLDELVKMICWQWDIQSRDRLHVEVEERHLYILGDHNRMIQVISNLIGNALKYSPDDRPVDIRVRRQADHVLVEVEDYGIGISEQDQPRIFQKFFRSGSTESRQIRGTGLGLFIAQRIVNDHEGVLSFTSLRGKGSVFAIRLPLLETSEEWID
ncbi:ATP-binding protein [Paenibacillus sp. WLX1005]|uniref:sensor histidine kinase n=1 Tax=Paenibacillus sp. WLX1005 TaxID=3243766 RepID=UPI003984078E